LGHFYKQTGEAFHQIEKIDGSGLRDVTLRDAKKYKLVPSVTNIIGILDKPGLTIWKDERLLEACAWSPFRSADYYDDDGKKTKAYEYWCNARKRDAKQEGRQASDIGKMVHANLESLFKGEALQYNDYSRIAVRAYDDIRKELGEDNYIAEQTFAYKGFGGTCDLSSDKIILDFKTKNIEDLSKVKAYHEHSMQLAAYKKGLDKPNAVCYNIFISTKVEGLYKWIKWSDAEIKKAYKMFLHLKRFWELSNGI